MFAFYILLGYCLVGQVGYHLGSHTEIWGAVNVPHGGKYVKPYQLLVAGILIWYEEGNGRGVLHNHPQPHVHVLQFDLAKVDRPRHGSAMRTCWRMQWNAPPKRISSMKDKRVVSSFSPLHVKSKMRRGLLPTWSITATGDSHRLWRANTSSKGKTSICYACTCSARSA